MTEAERSEALIQEWKQSLFDREGPGGRIEMDELDTIIGASSIAGNCSTSCCPQCTSNCC
jgi:hypothetical protein